MVIVTRNIDLSVGSVLCFVGMIIALLQIEVFPADAARNWPATVAIGIALGTLIGLWHGFLVAYVRIPSFVVTLAGLLIFRGAAFEVAQGQTLSPFRDGYRIFGGGSEGSLGETASWVLALLCVVGAVIAAMRAWVTIDEHHARGRRSAIGNDGAIIGHVGVRGGVRPSAWTRQAVCFDRVGAFLSSN